MASEASADAGAAAGASGEGKADPGLTLRGTPPSTYVLGLQNLVVDDVSLGCLGKRNPLRRAVLMLARSPLWSNFILLNILVNFILLAGAGPDGATLAPAAASSKGFNAVSSALEPWFQAIFTFEMVAMIVALGEKRYFTDGWRLLDFLVVVLCYLVYIPGTGNASALRALRALRPLRTFGILPDLRATFAGILAIAQVTVTMSLLEWFLEFVFTLVGVQLWAGVMSGGCFALEGAFGYAPTGAPFGVDGKSSLAPVSANTALVMGGIAHAFPNGLTAYRNRPLDNLAYNGYYTAGSCYATAGAYSLAGLTPGTSPATNSPYPDFGGMGGACPPVYSVVNLTRALPQVCLPYANILSYGAQQQGMGYDNVGIGWLTTVVADSEEGWGVVVQALWSTWGSPWLVAGMFIALILFKDEFMGWLDGASFVAYSTAVGRERKRMGLADTLEGRGAVQRLELAALEEMYGAGAVSGKDVFGAAERASAGLRAALWAPLTCASRCLQALPSLPAAITRAARTLETTPTFRHFYLALVLANAIALGCTYAEASPEYNAGIVVVNYIFVALFALEVAVRWCSLGLVAYWGDGLNAFDGIVVVISIIEIIVQATTRSTSVGLSALRVLRVFKLARVLKPLRDMTRIITRALPAMGSISFICLVLMLVFAAIGQQVFGGRYADALVAGRITEYPRHHYDNFGWAMVSVFHLLDGENWFIPLYQHMAVAGPQAALFFFCVMFVGAIVWGITLTIFMKGFDEQEEEDQQLRADGVEAAVEAAAYAAEEEDDGGVKAAAALARALAAAEARKMDAAQAYNAALAANPPTFAFDAASHSITLHFPAPPAGLRAPSIMDSDAQPPADAAMAAATAAHRATVTFNSAAVVCVDGAGEVVKEGGSSALTRLLEGAPWGWLSLAFTLVACLNLALDEPFLQGWAHPNSAFQGSGNSALAAYLLAVDAIVVAFLCIETALHAAAAPARYLRSAWGMMDVLVAVTSIAGLVLGQLSWAGAPLRAIRAARSIRALRVFRLLRHLTSLHAMLTTLGAMLPRAASAGAILLIFIYVFAVIGLQSFAGKAKTCNDPYAALAAGIASGGANEAAACKGTFVLNGPTCALLPTYGQEMQCRAGVPTAESLKFPRHFESMLPNYDHIGMAFLSVFQLADGENWPTLMYQGVDASGTAPGAPLQRNESNQWAALYYVLIVLVFDLVVLDLFAGVVRTGYFYATGKAAGRSLVSHAARKVIQNAQLVLESEPAHAVPASAALLPAAHRLVYAPAFEWGVLVVLIASALCCGQWRYPMPTGTPAALNGCYYVLTVALVLETLLRLAAAGPRYFIRNGWNIFDAVVSVIAAGGMLLALAAAAGSATDYGIMRIALSVRTLRFLNLVRAVRATQQWLAVMQPTLRAMRRAAPAVLQVFFLKFVFIFAFAIVGMAAFGNVRRGYPGDNLGGNPGRSSGNLNHQTNFENFPMALWTLFRGSTGENWNMVMMDLMVDAPYCIKAADLTNTCGNPVFAPIYWCLFALISSLIIDPLIAVVCIEAFLREFSMGSVFVEWADPIGRRLYNFTHGAAEPFRDAWVRVDPTGEAGVTRVELEGIVSVLEYPLGVVPLAGEVSSEELVMEVEGGGAGGAAGEAAPGAAAALVEALGIFAGGDEAFRVSYHTALAALVMNASVKYTVKRV